MLSDSEKVMPNISKLWALVLVGYAALMTPDRRMSLTRKRPSDWE